MAPAAAPPVAAPDRAGPPAPDRAARDGVWYAAAAYAMWGLFPLYFKALGHVPATQILAHRVVWSLLFLAGLLTARHAWRSLDRQTLRGTWPTFVATSVLLSSNWLIYIWSVNSGRVLESSLGYFITPLLNVLLGVVFLGETLTRSQRVAVALAGAGVGVLLVGAGTVPWIALALAGTFSVYGLLRKRLAVDAIPALFVETGMMAPLALLWLAFTGVRGTSAFATAGLATDLLLVGSGIATAVPLLCFAKGARHLRLTTMGVLQYLSPTGQFLLAVFVFGEPFGTTRAVAFGLIWAALAVYTGDAIGRVRRS